MKKENIPILDLHGLDRDSARSDLLEFIKEQFKLGNKKVIIIHGQGKGIIKNEVHCTLKKNKYVQSFYLDFNNPGLGSTIVELK
jgi:DNA-nicking Smr family endonuclease